MKRIVLTVDDIQLLIVKGVTLHPSLHDFYCEQLTKKEHLDLLCLTPPTKLELFNIKFYTHKKIRLCN